jgi:dihydroorotate dehydrogenase (NAD+) catalytic subunit
MNQIKTDFIPSKRPLRRDMFEVEWPFTIPSGIITANPAVIARIASEIDEIGFLTTKTLSLEPRPGYREPVISEYHRGCFVNAVGLPSPGAESFANAMKEFLPLRKSKPLLVSIMGSVPEEFLRCAEVLNDVADGFELNLSCPHVKAAGQSIGSDPDMVDRIVRLLSESLSKPIIPKLSPNVGNIVEIACICEKAGASALSLINTVGPGMAVDDEGNPVLSNVVGGISGAAIKPIGLKIVRDVAEHTTIPIIASGGISSYLDVEAYRKAGAHFFAVGSALAGMSTEEVRTFFRSIGRHYLTKRLHEEKIVNIDSSPITKYSKTEVAGNRLVARNMFILELESGPACDPGQFFFLRLPGFGEKPFSPMIDSSPLYLVRSVGPFTEKLSTLKQKDTVYIRGPYGVGFKEPKPTEKLILLGGGSGVAPIIMAACRWGNSVKKSYLGFSEDIGDEFQSLIRSFVPSAKILIDPPGCVGTVVDYVQREAAVSDDDISNMLVYMCGPRAMMKRAGDIFSRLVSPGRIFMAREDIMKCGIGLCGSCGTEKGLRSCVDGPVFSIED